MQTAEIFSCNPVAYKMSTYSVRYTHTHTHTHFTLYIYMMVTVFSRNTENTAVFKYILYFSFLGLMLHFFCNFLFYICILIFPLYLFHLFVITMCMHTYINGLLYNRRTVYQSKMGKMKQKQRMSRCIRTGDFSLLTVAINCFVICTISLIA